MKKTRNKKWRHVYPYVCGNCGKKRIAFDHERAKGKRCRVCQPGVLDENQLKLLV